MTPTSTFAGAVVTGTVADLGYRLDAERRAGRSVGVVLTMGAGNIGAVAQDLKSRFAAGATA